MALSLTSGERAKRKYLLTVAEWYTGTGTTQTAVREILGVRVEDSSIELNPDIETITDILGVTYTDVNKTEPQQTFDPFTIIGGSALAEYLTQAVLENAIEKYNNVFNVYVIATYMSTGTENTYYAVKHEGCSIIPTAIGGDSWVNMPLEVHYSNNIKVGTVNSLTSSFVFTENS